MFASVPSLKFVVDINEQPAALARRPTMNIGNISRRPNAASVVEGR